MVREYLMEDRHEWKPGGFLKTHWFFTVQRLKEHDATIELGCYTNLFYNNETKLVYAHTHTKYIESGGIWEKRNFLGKIYHRCTINEVILLGCLKSKK